MKAQILKALLNLASLGCLAGAGMILIGKAGEAPVEIDPDALAPVQMLQKEKAGALDHARLEVARLSRRPSTARQAHRPRKARPPLASRLRLVAVIGQTAVIEDKRTRRQEVVSIGASVFGARLVAIGADSVTLEEGGQREVLGGGRP